MTLYVDKISDRHNLQLFKISITHFFYRVLILW